jgi:hypothetical protein
MRLDFEAKLVATGPKGAWCFLHFPFDMEKTFGTRARVPVAGTINGFEFRSSLMPMDGRHVLCINKTMQNGAKARPGDLARFVLERDDEPRIVSVPPALKKTLAANPKARSVFDKLSYSHRKEYADWVGSAKQEETVKRRLKKLITMLLSKAGKTNS